MGKTPAKRMITNIILRTIILVVYMQNNIHITQFFAMLLDYTLVSIFSISDFTNEQYQHYKVTMTVHTVMYSQLIV